MNEDLPTGIRPETIDRYVAGDDKIEGRTDVVKLSSNENPFGPGTLALKALAGSLGGIARYPSTDHADLRAAIAETHGFDPERIVCGAGSDEVLGLICHAFAGNGAEVMHTRHGFLMYPILAKAVGAEPVEIDETERRVDVERILDGLTSRTRIIFLANPNNPTGTMLDSAELQRLADGLPQNVLLVLDGAYVEYAGIDDGSAHLAESRPNVVITRTFSKIHGLASLRIGFGYGPRRVIEVLDLLRNPFNVGGPALAAAAAAVRDTGHIERSRIHNSEMRQFMAKRLAEAGVPSDRSYANFVLARFESPQAAQACDAALRSAGIIVRRTDAYKLPNLSSHLGRRQGGLRSRLQDRD